MSAASQAEQQPQPPLAAIRDAEARVIAAAANIALNYGNEGLSQRLRSFQRTLQTEDQPDG